MPGGGSLPRKDIQLQDGFCSAAISGMMAMKKTNLSASQGGLCND
jgi:hypothetical protein